MAELVKFTSTRLNGTGKAGLLKPDSLGYYETVIGGLDVFNSAGEFYTMEGASALFEKSSSFMRRVESGCLKAETGHPKRLPGMTNDDYLERIMRIEETNVCAHIAEIWLDPNFGRNRPELKNPKMVAIMAKIKPAGPNGPALAAAFENPRENVCFSIRALTKDYYQRGQVYRVLNTIFTFDWVTEPGINAARKWNSPALESLDETFVSRRSIENVADLIRSDGASLESSRMMVQEALEAFKITPLGLSKTKLSDW